MGGPDPEGGLCKVGGRGQRVVFVKWEVVQMLRPVGRSRGELLAVSSRMREVFDFTAVIEENQVRLLHTIIQTSETSRGRTRETQRRNKVAQTRKSILAAKNLPVRVWGMGWPEFSCRWWTATIRGFCVAAVA